MKVIYLLPDLAMNKVVSHIPGVVLSVRGQAQKIGAKAESRLARHRDTGAASVSITYGDVDSFVNLDDEAALSIEFGHVHNFSGQYVPGLYILSGAAGLI